MSHAAFSILGLLMMYMSHSYPGLKISFPAKEHQVNHAIAYTKFEEAMDSKLFIASPFGLVDGLSGIPRSMALGFPTDSCCIAATGRARSVDNKMI